MEEQVAIQKILRCKLAEIQARNRSFSVRAFAKQLGLQASATNEILKGERRVSRKMAERIASRLSLDPSERTELLRPFPRPRRPRKDKNAPQANEAAGPDVLKLNADQFEAIAEWRHFAVLSMVKLRHFKPDPLWISSRLGITEKQAQDALERLLRLNLIERKSDGSLRRTHQKFNTSDDILNPALQRSHSEDMELARQSLFKDSVELRDFTSITMPVSPTLLPKAKELIRRAQDEIAELLESEPQTEVYRLSVYLYPLTRPEYQAENLTTKKEK